MMTQTPKTVADIGEFGLIARLNVGLTGRTDGVALGVGDDAAALRVSPGHLLLATCDVQIEGVHFLRHVSSPEDVGWKAIAVNVSDIAAMAGRPRFAMVSLALPADTGVDFVDELYAGIRACCDAFNLDVVGGNVARTAGPIAVDVSLLGEVPPAHMIRRSGAQTGDVILVSGFPGQSAAGLDALLHPERLPPDRAASSEAALLAATHRRPQPRVPEARAAAATGAVHAMIDLSDGLAPDLGHIAEMSDVGAIVEEGAVPISPALRTVATALGADPLDYALRGGEDYELLLTVAPTAVSLVKQAMEDATGTRLTAIGEIRPAAEGLRLRRPDGLTEPLTGALFRHF